jgi:hypothetical protein
MLKSCNEVKEQFSREEYAMQGDRMDYTHGSTEVLLNGHEETVGFWKAPHDVTTQFPEVGNPLQVRHRPKASSEWIFQQLFSQTSSC